MQKRNVSISFVGSSVPLSHPEESFRVTEAEFICDLSHGVPSLLFGGSPPKKLRHTPCYTPWGRRTENKGVLLQFLFLNIYVQNRSVLGCINGILKSEIWYTFGKFGSNLGQCIFGAINPFTRHIQITFQPVIGPRQCVDVHMSDRTERVKTRLTWCRSRQSTKGHKVTKRNIYMKFVYGNPTSCITWYAITHSQTYMYTKSHYSCHFHSTAYHHYSLSAWLSGLMCFLSHSACRAWQLQRPKFKSRSWWFSVSWTNGRYARTLICQTDTEGLSVSSLNCDRSLHSGIRAPEL